ERSHARPRPALLRLLGAFSRAELAEFRRLGEDDGSRRPEGANAPAGDRLADAEEEGSGRQWPQARTVAGERKHGATVVPERMAMLKLRHVAGHGVTDEPCEPAQPVGVGTRRAGGAIELVLLTRVDAPDVDQLHARLHRLREPFQVMAGRALQVSLRIFGERMPDHRNYLSARLLLGRECEVAGRQVQEAIEHQQSRWMKLRVRGH